MAKAPAPGLSVEDWIQAGYTLLAEEGIKALKLDRLCARVGATKGSFYWHFTDMANYRAWTLERPSARGAARREHFRHQARPLMCTLDAS
jgi:AcrR family transcriptional regulator